jgi:hypothetical protein
LPRRIIDWQLRFQREKSTTGPTGITEERDKADAKGQLIRAGAYPGVTIKAGRAGVALDRYG